MAHNHNSPAFESSVLLELVTALMPFGKYRDRLLCDLPISYLEWFNRKGFPSGELGSRLSILYEIKSNGLEYLLKPLKKPRTPKSEK